MKKNISYITLPDNFHDITDFYLPEENPMKGIVYPTASSLEEAPEFTDIIDFMMKEAQKTTKLEFALELEHEDIRIILRGHSIKSVDGKVFIFRRLPSYIPKIDEIGMPRNIIELLLSERLNHGGLVIIAGETGQGKSTTAAATIAYRLSHFGSFCLTIEDPVELPLQGVYENEFDEDLRGVCFQTNVEGDEVFPAIKSALRCYPSVSNSILFLGEVRDSVMASEVLKIAANGHLVVTTMHGADLVTSLKRFLGLAMSHGNSNEAEVKSMFASVFRLMIHQKMEADGHGNKRIIPNVLLSPSSSSSIAARLKSGNVEGLATDIQTQNAQLKRGASLLKIIT